MIPAGDDPSPDARPLARLAELGLRLPHAPVPPAADVPALRIGTRVITSGQLPVVDSRLPTTGRLGARSRWPRPTPWPAWPWSTRSPRSTPRCRLDDVARVVRVRGFVASADGFTDQPAVVDGASHLLEQTFGERGRHVRSAVGVAWLPLGSPVEVELEVEVRA